MELNPIKQLWGMFNKTKDNAGDRILVGFKVNKHLWDLWSVRCASIGKKPNQVIETLIEEQISKELKEGIENETKKK